ncbi:hypothetical protein EDC01DRAFT_785346 [Geopyxis carbonaria]|nr:hypothetical protein EDC01DRAFT_785346 [Geopyxis carbonaria]
MRSFNILLVLAASVFAAPVAEPEIPARLVVRSPDRVGGDLLHLFPRASTTDGDDHALRGRAAQPTEVDGDDPALRERAAQPTDVDADVSGLKKRVAIPMPQDCAASQSMMRRSAIDEDSDNDGLRRRTMDCDDPALRKRSIEDVDSDNDGLRKRSTEDVDSDADGLKTRSTLDTDSDADGLKKRSTLPDVDSDEVALRAD